MSIVLRHLVKRYGAQTVVNDVSLEVAEGELFVLLGPSGSGKSTALRMIAGLTEVDGGRVFFGGEDVTAVPPQQRHVGFVFQHYALFRHMTVAENIEFALRIRRMRRSKRQSRRDELLELVGLDGLGGRMPAQLSGGQQQRVALARALAHQPHVLLLDEPFGALDAKIRAELRRTIRTIQRELKITTLFVTHDQEEAFELADRLGVMNFGRLLEVGGPQELYFRPQTEFVAMFLGTANLMVGQCGPEGVRLGSVRLPLGAELTAQEASRQVGVLFRPEDVAVKDAPDALGWPLLGQAVVEESDFSGSYERLRLRLPPLSGVRPISPPTPFGSDFMMIEASRSQHQARRFPLRPGDPAWVGIRRVHILTHPGLSLLLAVDDTPESEAALALCAEIARLAHPRVTLLASGPDDGRAQIHLQRARERMGSGLFALESGSTLERDAGAVAAEADRREVDLLIHGYPDHGGVELAERLLRAGEHHLLLVPAPAPTGAAPSKVLVCVAVGEPSKEWVHFAGRLVRRLGARSTVLTVLPEGSDDAALRHAERFLASAAKTLSVLGVPSETRIRRGAFAEEIANEAETGAHDLVILGTPLADRDGRVRLGGVVSEFLTRNGGRPVLVVRSRRSREGF